MKHLNDELILSWISGDLAEDQLAMAKKHVDDCNTCFLRFSVLMKSQKDITGKSLEKAPSDVINKVKELLGLEQDEKRTEDFPPRISGISVLLIAGKASSIVFPNN